MPETTPPTPHSPTAPPLDAQAASRWQRVALQQAQRGGAPWLHEEVGRRMVQRLDWIKSTPAQWINWRALPSGAQTHARVQAQYPDSKSFLAPVQLQSTKYALQLIASQSPWQAWLARFSGRATRMAEPVPEGSAQLLWANMSLHTEPDPAQTVAQWQRMLAVDGFVMFSCLGPDTAIELRQIYAQACWPPAAHPLTDMHDWGDLLVRSGFAEPVMDMERIRLSFATPQRALQELRGLGRNLHPARFAGLRGQQWLQQLHERMKTQLSNAQGEIELSFEIIYGHAFKPVPRPKLNAESAISIGDMRAMLSHRRSS